MPFRNQISSSGEVTIVSSGMCSRFLHLCPGSSGNAYNRAICNNQFLFAPLGEHSPSRHGRMQKANPLPAGSPPPASSTPASASSP
nr:MAG TPA: hypothetical protein [Caudoviricetes sp.]